MLIVVVLSAAPLIIYATPLAEAMNLAAFAPKGGIDVLTDITQTGTNSDNDNVKQRNKAEVKQDAENTAVASSGVSDSAFVINGGGDTNTATAPSIQSSTIGQSNTNVDNDNQEIDQCATGPTVINIVSCANLDVGEYGFTVRSPT